MLGMLLLPLSCALGAETRLTLAQALERAAAENPTLAALHYESRAAEGLAEQAGLRPNPTLDITGENFLGTGRVQGVRSLETTVQATQVIERGGKRGKRVALASRARDLAAAEFAQRRAELLLETAEAFVQLLAAQERLILAQKPLNLARSTMEAVETRLSTGAASKAEAARAKAALATAQAEFARTEAAVTAARSGLAATWGAESGADLVAEGRLDQARSLPDRDTQASIPSRHPALSEGLAQVEAQRASLELEKANARQDLSVGGGLRFLREGSDATFVAGISIPLTVNNRNQGNIRAARERLSGAEQSLRATESQLRARLAAARQDLAAARTVLTNLRNELLPATQEAYEAVRKAYEVGQLPLINVIDSQRDLVAVQREILDAETSCAIAQVRLHALTDPGFHALSTALSQR